MKRPCLPGFPKNSIFLFLSWERHSSHHSLPSVATDPYYPTSLRPHYPPQALAPSVMRHFLLTVSGSPLHFANPTSFLLCSIFTSSGKTFLCFKCANYVCSKHPWALLVAFTTNTILCIVWDSRIATEPSYRLQAPWSQAPNHHFVSDI